MSWQRNMKREMLSWRKQLERRRKTGDLIVPKICEREAWFVCVDTQVLATGYEVEIKLTAGGEKGKWEDKLRSAFQSLGSLGPHIDKTRDFLRKVFPDRSTCAQHLANYLRTSQ